MDRGATCEHLNKLADHLGKELRQTKEQSVTCFDCGCPGPNLWVCLQPDCHHIGCSEGKNDHSTIHQKNYPSHCVHMNISTERIWCYICEKEVHVRAALAHAAMGPDSTCAEGAGAGVPDSDPEDMDYEEDDDQPRGLVGLQNMGNTCYMNAALQALSNTAPLTSYFLECAGIVSILSQDKKPGLSRAYQKLVKDMWSRKTRGYVVPNGILYGIRNVHAMFRGYQQHDTQEFLRCFLDQLHEELKEPVWALSDESLPSEAAGDHRPGRAPAPAPAVARRRAASSGASDAPFLTRMRRKSPAPSCYSDTRADGYLRVSGEGSDRGARHRRSASYGGTHHVVYTAHNGGHYAPEPWNSYGVGVGGGRGGRGAGSASDSEGSCSGSSRDDRYETCSSGSDAPAARDRDPNRTSAGGGDGAAPAARFRSIVSDVFDGKLLSSVQCLICDRVSTRVETFQDLSLPIPSREHLAALRGPAPTPQARQPQDSWVWWVVGWLRSWFYGPVVSLQDCLAAFFSADELKGDNMYSCSRCNKLRNGVKTAGVVRLPEVLCVHLKRFRHELMFSAKVAQRVSFPVQDLNMAPYTHKDCTSRISRYELCAVISHAGTAGGGHYTCAAANRRRWFAFDDHAVAPLPAHHLAAVEAYVLFYKKVNPQMAALRTKAAEILDNTACEPNDLKFYISKQWINKFNTWAEPGPIDNSDFVCRHGAVRPDRANALSALAAPLPQPLWEFLRDTFGGGPAVTHAHECGVCARAAARLRQRRASERAAFASLHAAFQEQERPRAVYAISMHWFRQWQAFVRNKTAQPPPPVDNTGIVTQQDADGGYALKAGSDHAQLSAELWRFFTDIYGGGPAVPLRPLPFAPPPSPPRRPDHRSSSELDIREPYQVAKNQSLQNLGRPGPEDEPQMNGDCGDGDSDEDMDEPARLTNGVVDANDNPLPDSELPDMEAISLKSKPSKPGRVRKMKRRTVK